MSPPSFIHPDPLQSLTALESAQCILSYDAQGVIRAANRQYLDLCGYREDELIGQNMTVLMHPDDRGSQNVDRFWAELRAGRAQVGESRRRRRDGSTYWVNAAYTPVMNHRGELVQVVAFAMDITESRSTADAARARLAALSRSQAMIEFAPNGDIIDANDNFCRALGFTLDEIKGRNHRMLCPPDQAHSVEYDQFWRDLTCGEFRVGEFDRIGKGGRLLHLVASYNPVRDAAGSVTGIVLFATDITRQTVAVNELMAGLERLRQGDLRAELSDAVTGEFRHVRSGFNSVLKGFQGLIRSVRRQSRVIQHEAQEIACASQDLAQRGESQAAALEQTAASVEQISGNIDMTSIAAREADASARSAREIVLEGARIVEQAIAAMTRIEEHTRKMADFTRVIEGFAFQTNLLSINAAVEAARAGEVGRGFAVVASEVRNLAQQSASASKNIAELIGKSDDEVKSGVRLVTEAGQSLRLIQQAVGGMAENISGIAHATTEQATGVREVSEALAQLDQVNQANLAVSDKYAAAASALTAQVGELNDLIARYVVQDGGYGPPSADRRVA